MASLSEGWAKLNSPVNIRRFNRIELLPQLKPNLLALFRRNLIMHQTCFHLVINAYPYLPSHFSCARTAIALRLLRCLVDVRAVDVVLLREARHEGGVLVQVEGGVVILPVQQLPPLQRALERPLLLLERLVLRVEPPPLRQVRVEMGLLVVRVQEPALRPWNCSTIAGPWKWNATPLPRPPIPKLSAVWRFSALGRSGRT